MTYFGVARGVLVFVILFRDFDLDGLDVVQVVFVDVYEIRVVLFRVAVSVFVQARLLDVVEEVGAELLLGRLAGGAFDVVVVVVDALAEVELEVRVHVLLRVLREAQAALGHAVVEERVRLLLAVVDLRQQVRRRRLLQEIRRVNILAQRRLHDRVVLLRVYVAHASEAFTVAQALERYALPGDLKHVVGGGVVLVLRGELVVDGLRASFNDLHHKRFDLMLLARIACNILQGK